MPQYRDRSLRRICTAICILLATWAFTRSLLPYLSACDHSHHQTKTPIVSGDQHPSYHVTSENHTRKVSLEAHIMSKCPDAKACLQELVVPAMEKVSDKVDFNLSFIGT
jgi:metallophosphoesterase superfamily enzyme